MMRSAFCSLPWMLAALLTLSPSAAGATLEGWRVPTLAPGAQGAAFRLGLPGAPTRLTTLRGSGPSCVASPYETPGQGWLTGLSAGGVTRRAKEYQAQPPAFAVLFGLSPAEVQTGPAPVRVVVVDHFAPVEVRLKEAEATETWPLRHGELVLAHLLTVLSSAGYSVAPTPRGDLQARKGASVIVIEKLQLDGLRPPGFLPGKQGFVSAEVLASLLARDDKSTPPNAATIYNMSFAVLSCEYLTHYRSVRDAYAAQDLKYTLNDYVADTARANRISEEEVLRRVTELPPESALRRWLAQGWPRKVVVASSGNYGLPVQTWPAAAPTVIGVGASAWAPRTARTGWSDVGDTYSVGEWFRLSDTELKRACQTWKVCVTDELKLASPPARYNDFGYRGTSFAAPSVTAFLAMRLSASGAGKGCFKAAGTGFVPVVKLDPAKATPIDKQGKPFTAAGLNINRACP
ncbi:hypothetical protein SAMN04488058_107121 [Deinococcus reticulitermitis]|uniref:Peptidase S8/S53 domain-containing protein n=1 Tax=Deinococcus reticulitermitis TaxID=856736 RepID=A0A1H6YHH7_9DEIO|nr:S8 family serine peptidase [Deinococcus reticulitermitis]SEJ40753.1 hypothetical protein SAMN04488058_107121 [Deinococcus reticulitermitis]